MTTKARPYGDFQALEVARQLVRALRGVMAVLREPKLADQLRRAADSVVLNLGEGSGRYGRDARYHYAIALGSVTEVRAALLAAADWGHVEEAVVADAVDLAGRVRAMTWVLVHGRSRPK